MLVEKSSGIFPLLFRPTNPFLTNFFFYFFFIPFFIPCSLFLSRSWLPPVGKSTAINIGNALYCYFALHQTIGRITQVELRKLFFYIYIYFARIASFNFHHLPSFLSLFLAHRKKILFTFFFYGEKI